MGVLLAGWLLAATLLVAVAGLRRRLSLVADAEHELRGPVTALALAAQSLERQPGTRSQAAAMEAELHRMRCGLADLAAARHGRRSHRQRKPVELRRLVESSAAAWRPALGAARSLRLDWGAGAASSRTDPRRVAQVLGNLLANAAEHGSGSVELRGHRTPEGVRIEVSNRAAAGGGGLSPDRDGRGRGRRIAMASARAAGGRLSFPPAGDEVRAVLDLPPAEQP